MSVNYGHWQSLYISSHERHFHQVCTTIKFATKYAPNQYQNWLTILKRSEPVDLDTPNLESQRAFPGYQAQSRTGFSALWTCLEYARTCLPLKVILRHISRACT